MKTNSSVLHPPCRRSLFLLKLGSFQFAVLKIAFTVLSIVLYTNDNFDLTDVSVADAHGHTRTHTHAHTHARTARTLKHTHKKH